MALFRRKKAQPQTPPEQISFEGQQPVLSTSFKLEYDEILQGLTVAAANRENNRAKWGLVLYTIFSAIITPFMFRRSLWMGLLFLAVTVYLVVNSLFGEETARRGQAKTIAAGAKEVTLTIFATGVRVNDGQKDYNIPYRVMKMYENDQAFMTLLGKTMMLSFPKRCFGADLPLIREIFTANLGAGRRFFTVDEKGRVTGGTRRS